MKKLFFSAALFFASMAADAQEMAFNSNIIIGDYNPAYDVTKAAPTPDEPCIEFKRSDNTQLQGQQWNTSGDSVIFTWQVTIYIEKVGAGNFEKVDNFTQTLALTQMCDKPCLQVKGNAAADAYIFKNYPNIQ